MLWTLEHPRATQEMLGYLPEFLSEHDPDSAQAQLDKNYVFGGFQPFEGFKFDPIQRTLNYPGDPPMRAIGHCMLRDEQIILFEAAWVAIVQQNGDFVVARMD